MKFLLKVDQVFEALLLQEDTDYDKKITKNDLGPKIFVLVDENTKEKQIIEGAYHLSNLLQELAVLKEKGEVLAELDLNCIQENPVERISRKIKDSYWDEFTRTIDKKGLKLILEDVKTSNEMATLYVSEKDQQRVSYTILILNLLE